MSPDALPNGRPNVVVFYTDQQRWDTTGIHGNPLGLTPNFDRMALEGTWLQNFCTNQPVCGPARAALQTGRYATTAGCFLNGLPLPQTERTMAHHLRDAGYRTGYIGKWHLGSQDPVPKDERGGYDYWLAANMLELTSEPYETVLFDEDNEEVRLPGYRVDALTDAAIRYLADHQREPFFLFVSYLEPHHQNRLDSYPAPEGYREQYTGRWMPPDLAALRGNAYGHIGGYYGMVKRLDEALGRILDTLRSLRILDDTIVLFTSDHGNHFKTRNAEYKRSCHEASIRVPTAIRGPGFDGGHRVSELTGTVDLAPTVLDAVGLDPPPDMEGRSVLPLLRGVVDDPWPDDLYIQISQSQVGRAIRTSRWKYSVSAPDADPVADAGAPRYVEEYLYDLETDPWELDNLVGLVSQRPVADVLRERLLRRMVAVEGYAAEIEPAPSRPDVTPARRALRAEELHL